MPGENGSTARTCLHWLATLLLDLPAGGPEGGPEAPSGQEESGSNMVHQVSYCLLLPVMTCYSLLPSGQLLPATACYDLLRPPSVRSATASSPLHQCHYMCPSLTV